MTRKIKGHGGIGLAVDTAGNPADRSVVLLHGGGQTRHAWGDALHLLADQGYYVISADLRGHGDSDWAPDGGYTLDHFAADIRILCEHCQQPPVLIGASLGGLAALAAQGTAAEPLARGLALVDIVPQVNPEGVGQILAFMQAHPQGFASLEEAADSVAQYLPHRGPRRNVQGLQKNLRLQEDGRYYWHWDPKFIGSDDLHSSIDRLEQTTAAINVPVLLIRGSDSNVVDQAGMDHMRERIPHARFREIPGAGHMVVGDSNNAFTCAVLEFLSELES